MTVRDKIEKAGIDNCMFLVPMRPIRRFLGIGITSSSDSEIVVPAIISQDRYKLSKNYKITLEAMDEYKESFGHQHYYLSDLNLLIENGTIKMFIKA